MIGLLSFLAVGVATPLAAPGDAGQSGLMADAVHALEAGRFDQARLMSARAVASGASGPQIDKLLADLVFATGNYSEALVRYQALRQSAATGVCEPAAIAAIRLGDLQGARELVDCATGDRMASWRAWNARGVLADLDQDWVGADNAYADADRLSPNQPQVINNRGYSELLRGNWVAALGLFERAAALDPGSHRIANNLELTRAAMAQDLPPRRRGESDRDWAVRLNDAGVAAQVTGDKQRAIAAFSQALEASGSWYARAANNLQVAGAE